ncbi:hypothetical protein [Methylobacterium sp. Leaf125]|jgi:hypothetical protein|uniref:hypothetical protein n=1 Tax=Methylobacterium sp. Leaf125 TaxID=1736265 RepID=UPI0012E0E5EC|nr:hypothetical protein [Methylobacterium sp. Leaf125]
MPSEVFTAREGMRCLADQPVRAAWCDDDVPDTPDENWHEASPKPLRAVFVTARACTRSTRGASSSSGAGGAARGRLSGSGRAEAERRGVGRAARIGG